MTQNASTPVVPTTTTTTTTTTRKGFRTGVRAGVQDSTYCPPVAGPRSGYTSYQWPY